MGEDFPPLFFMSTYKSLIVGSRSGIGLALKNKLISENEDVIHIYRNSEEEDILDLAKEIKDEKIKNIYFCLGTITLKSVLSTTSNQLIEDFKVNLVYAHEIIKLFPNSKEPSNSVTNSRYRGGKAKVHLSIFHLEKGKIQISCFEHSEDAKKNGKSDVLAVAIYSLEFDKYLASIQ